MAGGREVFARDGYVRASIDAIAVASGVSTRTIYKHFSDKPALFAAVIIDSAARVAEAEIALVERHLSTVTRAEELESALRAFALEWLDDSAASLAGMPDSAVHRALIGQVRAEAAHLGAEVIATWWRAGAGRVRAELARAFARLNDAGLLRIDDSERAAVQFSHLISAVPGPPAARVPTREREVWIVDGVRVFLRGCAP